ncbi:MAG: molybdopterin cofactor-binding domain-containing protein [Pseudomonadota bacterium]
MSALKLSRRKFLLATGITGAGLVVGIALQPTPPLPIGRKANGFIANAFLQITPDNVFRFYCPRDEMGQGITTGLTTLIGEELDVAPGSFEVEFAAVHSDYANPLFGVQATGGSTSLAGHWLPLRQAGADVRQLLLDAAAEELGTARSALETADGHVVADGRMLPYGQFVARASHMEMPSDTPLKPRGEWRYIGAELPRVDGLAKSTGSAVFGIDIDIPGMHRAVVKRSPVPGSKLKSANETAVMKLPGVTDLVRLESGIAVVAEQFWQARKAVDALTIEWEIPPEARMSTADLRRDYADAMRHHEAQTTGTAGDLETGFNAATATIDVEYWAPFLAHAPMEPMNAVVRIEDGEVDVWSGTQGAAGAQGLVARHLDVDRDKVRVHSTYLGGGFGRRGTLGHIVEATEIARVTGKPIQLLWTREDDIRNGVYRPASLMRVKAGADTRGKMTVWQARRVGGNIMPDVLDVALPAFMPTAVPTGALHWVSDVVDTATSEWFVDKTSVEGLFGDYEIPNQEISHVTRHHNLPLSYWRSVGHSYTAFAKESAMDELAHAAGADPVEFRLANATDNPRLANVIRIAGARMRTMQPAAGRALGLAAHMSFKSYVAEVAEVSAEGGRIRVHRVLCVVDCGRAVNPDIVRAQMEGGIMYGLTATLHGNLELEDGAIKESNFHDYPILRMNEAPDVDVVIVESDETPTGVGEPGLPPIAPAVANAVFALTGERLRALPLRLG